MSTLNYKQEENIASNDVFEKKHPNAILIEEINHGGSRPYDHDILQVAFCPDSFSLFKRTLEGSFVSGELNSKGEHIPHTGEWEQIQPEDVASFLSFQKHRQYIPVGKWHLFDTVGKWQAQYIDGCQEEFGPDRIFALQPLHGKMA